MNVYKLIIILAVFTAGVQTATAQSVTEAPRIYEQAESAYLRGQYPEAIKGFTRCVQIDAAFFEAYPARAAAYERLGNWAAAISDYSIYLSQFPNTADVLFCRGIARFQHQQFTPAMEDFNQLLTLPVDSQETRTILYRQTAFGGTDRIITTQGNIKDQVYNYLGLAALALKDYHQARSCFDSAISLNPTDPDLYVNRGRVKQAQENLYGAEQDYRKALALNEDHALAYHNLGVVLKASGGAAAEEQFDLAIERQPSLPYPYLERAFFRIENGNLAGALTDYNQAIALQPGAHETWVNRGLVKEKLNDLSGAYADFTQAIELAPTFEKAWFCRANILSKQNKPTEAVEDYSVALLYFPEYAMAYYNRAMAEYKLGHFQKACADLQSARLKGIKINELLRQKVCEPQQ